MVLWASLHALLLCGATAAKMPQAPAALTLATDGATDFAIVLPAAPSVTEQFAAEELQRYLGAITGARFALSSRPTSHCLVVCRRGCPPSGLTLPEGAAQLPAEGYCLAQREGRLFLVGAYDRGTLYAVYDFLARVGCRWLAPGFSYYGGAHEVVPKRPTLAFSLKEEVLEAPAFAYRKLYVEEGRSHNLSNLLQMVEWMPKRRFNTLVVPLNYAGGGRVMWDNWRRELTPELQRRGLCIEVGGHGYENFLNAKMEGGRLFEQHPDWFGLNAEGKRVSNPHAVFCTSNAEARHYFIGNVLAYLEAHPEIGIFDFWPPDGARWCQCTNCTALGSPADRQALLLAEVAAAAHQHRPDLRFETIAYAACVAPPDHAHLDPSVLVDFCPIGQCFEYPINHAGSEKNAAYVGQLRSWVGSFTGDISIYSYYRKYAWRSLPNLIPHYVQKDLRFYRSLGVRGISSYAEPGDWATYELNHYVLGGLAWNPDANVEAMMAEFAQARFGAQAALGLKACRELEKDVRHYCSLPGTSLKQPKAYRHVAHSFSALVRELEAASRTSTDKAVAAALHRLALAVGYAQRDVALQETRAEGTHAAQRTAQNEELGRFLQAHADEGVFVTARIPAARPN